MTDDLVKNLLGLVLGGLTAFNTSILWQIRDLVKKHDQTLYGANGDNGLVGDMKMIRSRLHDQISHVTAHEMRITLLDGGHPGHGDKGPR